MLISRWSRWCQFETGWNGDWCSVLSAQSMCFHALRVTIVLIVI